MGFSFIIGDKILAKKVKRIAVTGGGGQIAYSLLFRLATGEIWGKEQPVSLHILELPSGLEGLKGVVMELEDCGFPLLTEIKFGSDPEEIFREVNLAILVGAKPRGPGMERQDLIQDNAKIFVEQGKALNRVAAKDIQVFVVGNPCNTNCWITMKCAKDIPTDRFHAMTRLDQNRAKAQLAKRANAPISEVDTVIIWGNHSATQVPDFIHATIRGKSALAVIQDRKWLEEEFITTVQKRGAAIISARGKSSAASAANAIIDSLRSLYGLKMQDEWFSSCLLSNGNPYGIEEDLIFSFPCRRTPSQEIEIVPGLEWDDFLREKIALTEKELIAERDMVASLVN